VTEIEEKKQMSSRPIMLITKFKIFFHVVTIFETEAKNNRE